LVLSEIHGEDDRMFSAALGWKALEDSIEGMGLSHPFTQLQVDLTDVDPDDAFSEVPYEKGFNLLYHLEQRYSRPAFLAFFKAYIVEYANRSITTDDFRNFLKTFMEKYYPDKATIYDAIDWTTWLYGRGYPPVGLRGKPPFTSTLIQQVEQLTEAWRSVLDSNETVPQSVNVRNLTVGQKGRITTSKHF